VPVDRRDARDVVPHGMATLHLIERVAPIWLLIWPSVLERATGIEPAFSAWEAVRPHVDDLGARPDVLDRCPSWLARATDGCHLIATAYGTPMARLASWRRSVEVGREVGHDRKSRRWHVPMSSRYQAQWARRGRTIHTPDALIAGTARAHGAVLVTDNIDDFRMRDIRVESLPNS
jgi:hypothetical protein